ncbi:MAG: pyridoxine 5'-phosphate synthase [Gammaproteobacteria bacterium]|nr:pyridoxine 5'-phosphate synthase [Gammaproteobacteria bacterium]
MTKLSVNLNKIALIRNSRDSDFPNLIDFARLCIKSGAHGLTIHPRPDQRHARYKDVYNLAALVQENTGIELNIEGNPIDKFLAVVLESKPTQCTLVPDEPGQLTSDHGWDVIAQQDRLRDYVQQLQEAGIRTSLFLDPDKNQIEASVNTGTERIELYTESYAKAYGRDEENAVLSIYSEAAKTAQTFGLGVNAGHDLNQDNLGRFLSIKDILEVSIGHALTVESLLAGFEKTIQNYLDIIKTISQPA